MDRVFLLKGASLSTDSGILPQGDVLVADGLIQAVGKDFPCPLGVERIDLSGCLLSYGFADLHVHFREPGAPQKETIRTGALAAARGGYTTVCAMPNLSPAPDSLETLALEQAIIDRDACIEVLPYATITRERKGLEVVDMEALKGRCVAFSDDGSGVQHDDVMLEAMRRAAELDCILAAHCEDNTLLHGGYIHDGRWCAVHGHKGICSESEWGQIARDLDLAAKTGCRYHICHVSTKESVALVREAKRSGVRVTCETGPHYLVLCEDDLQEDGRFKMNPPLRSAEDRDALREGILDGTVDAIATDHAPHTAEEKARGLAGSAMGIVGLETAFPILYTKLVLEGKLSLERLLDALCTTPRRIFRLGGALREGERADLTVLDLQAEYTIDSRTFLSKGHATPFDGMAVRGDVMMTLKNGKPVWKKKSIR
jgi:dihydroorotase